MERPRGSQCDSSVWVRIRSPARLKNPRVGSRVQLCSGANSGRTPPQSIKLPAVLGEETSAVEHGITRYRAGAGASIEFGPAAAKIASIRHEGFFPAAACRSGTSQCRSVCRTHFTTLMIGRERPPEAASC